MISSLAGRPSAGRTAATNRFVLRVIAGPCTGSQTAVVSRVLVGRGDGCDLKLTRDASVSRSHLTVAVAGDQLEISDEGSATGTWVAGRRLTGVTRVGSGTRLQLGDTTVAILCEAGRIPVEAAVPSLVLVCPGGGRQRYAVNSGLTIGRDPGCDVVVEHPDVSRVHAFATLTDGEVLVEDRGSRNGTRVNSRRISGPRPLRLGDRVTLGSAPQHLTLATAVASAVAPIQVRLRREGDRRDWAVQIGGGAAGTVGSVAAAAAAYLGASASAGENQGWRLYRDRDGQILHPDEPWASAGTRRGDRLVLAAMPPPPDSLPADAGGDAEGARVIVNQLPRSVPPPVPYAVRTPNAPDTPSWRARGVGWQLGGGFAAIVVAGLVALVRPAYALFALLGAVVGIITILSSQLADRARHRHSVKNFQDRLRELDEGLAAVVESQADTLRALSPEPDELAAWIAQRSDRLWERRPGDSDFLRLRVGTGDLPAILEFQDALRLGEGPPDKSVPEILARHALLRNVPVTTPGMTVPVIGLTGERGVVLDAASQLVVEAAALHAPHDLSIAVLSVNHDWAWARWLPHLEGPTGPAVSWNAAAAADLAVALQERLAGQVDRERSDPQHAWLVLVGHDASRVPAVAELLGSQVHGRAQFVVLADTPRQLPSEATVVIDASAGPVRVLGRYDGAPPSPFRLEGIDGHLAESLALRLARYADPRRTTQRSGSAGAFELLGLGAPEEVDVESSWSRPEREPLTVPVGTCDDGSLMTLGFRRDGPHGMVAGTTGSGKSELLQTMLVAVAVTHSPVRLNLFLIDFKGGATFSALARLPHVVGVVTDLERDGSLAERAFASLDAEIERRKRLLDAARVPNQVEYQRLSEAGAFPLPSLIVVIDEFALLVQQQPDVKERLDTIATQGRSLGVHLLLATQSPTGVITNAIRTNTNMWLCLRVVSGSESQELLGKTDAARIPIEAPGRGFLRRGAGESILAFQTARVTLPAGGVETSATVDIRPYGDIAPSGRAAPLADEETGRRETELDVATRRMALEAERLGVPPQRSLWLPPLGTSITAQDLPPWTADDRSRLQVPLGLLDEPRRQLQRTYAVDFTAVGNLLVLGVLGAGKSGALTSLGLSLAERYSPADLHLYGVDAGAGSLGQLGHLPHTAALVSVGDRELLIRLVNRLTGIMEQRRQQMAESGVGDFCRWRQASTLPAPWLLLALDDYPAFKEATEPMHMAAIADQLLSVAQNGPTVGIHLALATAQPVDLRTAFLNLFGEKVVLRQADVGDYGVIDLRIRPDKAPKGPAGRALVAGGLEVQIVEPAEERATAVVRRWEGVADGGPRRLERLPRDVALDAVLRRCSVGPDQILLGLGGSENEPTWYDAGRAGPHLLVLGDYQTGRSTTLLTCVASISAADADAMFLVLAPRMSPVRDLVGRPRIQSVATSADDITDVVAGLASRDINRTVLLVDDAESMPSSASEALERELRQARERGLRTVVAARGVDFGRLFDGWARYLQTMRSGLLLMPSGDAGYVFDVRLPPPLTSMVPGRGYLVDRGDLTLVQVARPVVSSGAPPPGVRPFT